MYRNKLFTLVLTALCLSATGSVQASFSRQQIVDNLIFLDQLNPFEQQNTLLMTNHNENANRVYFEWMGVSLTVLPAVTFARQAGDLRYSSAKYDSTGHLLNMFLTSEFHPVANLDVSLGARAWLAEAGSGAIKHYASGFPLVAKVTYNNSVIKASFMLGLDLLKSFSIYEEQRDLMKATKSAQLVTMAEQLNYLPASNIQTRFTLSAQGKLDESWWLAARAVVSVRAPVALNLLAKPTATQPYQELLDVGKRDLAAASLQLLNGRELWASFPFSSWTFAHYLSLDFESHRFWASETLGSAWKGGFSYGIKMRAVLPYVAVSGSFEFKLLNNRQSFGGGLEFVVSQW